MRSSMRIFAIAAALMAGLAAATPSLYAQDSRGSRDHGSMMRGGMMGQGGMSGQGGMMGMMGMMGMVEQMSQMMDHCSQMGMMGNDSGKPNEQWRKDAPATPEKKG